jgi:DNA-binding NarL/FixJ family response regulator
MNRNAILSKRQKQFIERIAWGASYKEVADFFHVSWSTVDNTLRNAKTKLGLLSWGHGGSALITELVLIYLLLPGNVQQELSYSCFPLEK